MMRTRLTLLKPVGGDHRSAESWFETRFFGWPEAQSRGLADVEAADVEQGGMTIERVPRGVASVNDVVPIGGRPFRIVGVIPRFETAGRLVDLECEGTKGVFRVADELTFGGDDLSFDGQELIE